MKVNFLQKTLQDVGRIDGVYTAKLSSVQHIPYSYLFPEGNSLQKKLSFLHQENVHDRAEFHVNYLKFAL